MKVLYLYSGERKKFKGIPGVDYPDTQFYGQNHFKNLGIEAEFKEFGELVKSKFIKKFIGFRLRHLLLYFFTRDYDVVFGSSILYMMFFRTVFKSKSKFVLLNMNLTRTINANKNKKIKLFIIKYLLSKLDGIVCLSRDQKNFLEDFMPIINGRLFFVPMGVDAQYYNPNYANRKDYILSAGRDNGRDYKTVIEAAQFLPDQEFQIVCSPRNLRDIRDISKNVRIFYDLPFGELVKKYYEAKALLMTTHDDKFLDGADCSGQTVVLEAMACGLPVMVTQRSYLKDYVENKRDVYIIKPDDPDSIVNSIKLLTTGTHKLLNMQISARKKIENHLSTELMALNLSEVFRTVSAK